MSSTTSTSRALDLAAQVLQHPHLAARLGAHAVGGDLEEVDLDRQVDLAHQVGDEDERAAQQPDDDELVGAGEEGRDLAGERLDAGGDRLRRDQLVDHVGPRRHALPSRPGLCRPASYGHCRRPTIAKPGAPMPTHAEKRHVPYSADADVRADRRRRPLPGVPALVRRRAGPQAHAAARRRRRGDGGRPRRLVQGLPREVRQPGDAAARRRAPSTSSTSRGRSATCRTTGASSPRTTATCTIDFFVDFEFRSAILQKLIGLVFHEAMLRIVRAFEKRAEALYGARATA